MIKKEAGTMAREEHTDCAMATEITGLFDRRMQAMQVPEETRAQMEQVLLLTLEQLELCRQVFAKPPAPFLETPFLPIDRLPEKARVGCQGVPGAFSQSACEELFSQGEITFYQEFEDVFAAVESGQVDYGVLPVENSSAGQVSQVLELVSHHRFSIVASRSIAPRYCLCMHPDTDPALVNTVISHPQGLMQCEKYLKKRGYTPQRFSNTAAAAQKVGQGDSTLACVCSRRSAELYGLRILEEDVQDYDENYTRFLCISAQNQILPQADTISITLQFPNEPGYLNRLLTRFAVCNLDLCKIMSMPVASRDFNVRFYLDFKGKAGDPKVMSLLGHMHSEFSGFRYLGNYAAEYGSHTPQAGARFV